MMEAIYQITQLKKAYHNRTVLDLEQLEIRAGEILALVGPSGAGKSTLLRLLNFLEAPTAGKLIYRNQEFANGNVPLSIRREITTVFQRPVLLDGKVRDNIAYGLHLRGVRSNGQVSDLLGAIGLHDLANAPATKLSGGEMQRVALARALVVEPTVLLLDEPTANLDPYNVGLIEEIVRQHNRERGTTIVVVTHNVFQAKRLAHRVGLMLGGRLVEVRDTAEFFDAPSDPRTTAFVRGEMVY